MVKIGIDVLCYVFGLFRIGGSGRFIAMVSVPAISAVIVAAAISVQLIQVILTGFV